MTKLGMGMQVIVAAALAIAGCSKSKCEKYADMEVKCGNVPDKDKDITRALAEGFCTSDKHADPAMQAMSARIDAEAQCASTTTDCAEYKKCTAALK